MWNHEVKESTDADVLVIPFPSSLCRIKLSVKGLQNIEEFEIREFISAKNELNHPQWWRPLASAFWASASVLGDRPLVR